MTSVLSQEHKSFEFVVGWRKAQLPDAEGIWRTIEAAYVVESNDGPYSFKFLGTHRTSLEEVKAYIGGKDGVTVYVIFEGSESSICGTVYYSVLHDKKAYFGPLAINPSSQGKGIGRQVIDLIKQQALRDHCSAVQLKVVSPREDIISWYARLGFKEVGRLPFPEPQVLRKPVDMLLMEMPL